MNLVAKRERAMQSHEIVLRLRPELEAIARARRRADRDRRSAARAAGARDGRGRGVRRTHGVPYARLRDGATAVAERLRASRCVSDVDTTVEASATRFVFVTDQEKAALSGVSTEDVARTVRSRSAGSMRASCTGPAR